MPAIMTLKLSCGFEPHHLFWRHSWHWIAQEIRHWMYNSSSIQPAYLKPAVPNWALVHCMLSNISTNPFEEGVGAEERASEKLQSMCWFKLMWAMTSNRMVHLCCNPSCRLTCWGSDLFSSGFFSFSKQAHEVTCFAESDLNIDLVAVDLISISKWLCFAIELMSPPRLILWKY